MGEGRSGSKDFQEGDISPAFILLTDLSSRLVVSCPLCRSRFSRCRASVIFLLWCVTVNGMLFLSHREEARLDETPCGRAHPMPPWGACSAAPDSDATTSCFSYRVRPNAISSVASGKTRCQNLILTPPPWGRSLAVHSTVGRGSPSRPGAHSLWVRPDEPELSLSKTETTVEEIREQGVRQESGLWCERNLSSSSGSAIRAAM